MGKDKKKQGLLKDFKDFISKGNVIQLAVAFIMGAAFTAIITSLTGDILMPFFSILVGKIDIGKLRWVVSNELTIYYGKFILAVVNFLFISIILFLIIKVAAGAEKGIKKLKKGGEECPPPPPIVAEKTEDILKDIRELLRQHNMPVESNNEITDNNK